MRCNTTLVVRRGAAALVVVGLSGAAGLAAKETGEPRQPFANVQGFFRTANSVLPGGHGPEPAYVTRAHMNVLLNSYFAVRVGQRLPGFARTPFDAYVVGKGPQVTRGGRGERGRVHQPKEQLAVALVLKKPVEVKTDYGPSGHMMLATVERFARAEGGKGIISLTHASAFAVFKEGAAPREDLIFPSGYQGSVVEVSGSPFSAESVAEHHELLGGNLTTGYRTFSNEELQALAKKDDKGRAEVFNDEVHVLPFAAHETISSAATTHPDLESTAGAYLGQRPARYGDALRGGRSRRRDAAVLKQLLTAMGHAEAMAFEHITGPSGKSGRDMWNLWPE